MLILLFAAVTFASHFLFPSVRWFLRRRAERLVAELNKRLERPIHPFKLLGRPDMILRLIYDPQVMEAVAAEAKATGVREDVAFEKARDFAREIVPSFSATVYFSFATRAAKWLSTRLFSVRVAGETRLSEIDRDATIVFVMNHRSNMDYVLVTYIAAKSSALAYAVGEWARVWPLRSLIRAMGGYFIRRRSRTALYRKVLARYVQMVTGAGVAQAVFPEGGLSLDGRLAAPKLGLLTYLISEFDGTGRDIVFVPVALNYDRVLEDQILLAAGAEGERRFRGSVPDAAAFTLRYVWRRITGRAHKMGIAGVAFGEPLSLRHFHGANGGVVADALATEIMSRIQRAMPVLPVPLVTAILESRDSLAEDELEAAFAAEVARLRAAGATVLIPENDGVKSALAILRRRSMVAESDGRLRIAPGRESMASYYSATVRPLMDAGAEIPGS